MPDHKFEPFDRVLVRYTSSETWKAAFISHVKEDGSVCCADGRNFLSKFVLPYDTNTKHLLNTSDPYKPTSPRMSEITVQNVGLGYINGNPDPRLCIIIDGYPSEISEAEEYAIKTALEKQVKLNAEVQRLKDRRTEQAATT